MTSPRMVLIQNRADSPFTTAPAGCNLAVLMLNVFITLLLIVHVVVCLLMSVLVLMQRPRKDGLGAAFGGGMTDTMFGAHTTTVLQKATVFLGGMFFIITLTLALLVSHQQRSLMAGDASPFLGDELPLESEAMVPPADGADDPAPVTTDPVLPPLPGDEPAAPTAPETDAEPTEAEPAEAQPEAGPEPAAAGAEEATSGAND